MQTQQSQNNREIANPEAAPTVKGPEMNDRDLLNDSLSTCKYLTDSLNVAIREASHEQFYADLLQILTDTHNSTRELYNLMFQNGWYTLEAVEQSKLQQAEQQFSGYTSQLPY